MIGAVVLLRDVTPYGWWPAKVWATDIDSIVPAAKVTAEAIKRSYGDVLRDPRWQRSLLEGRSPSEGD